MGLYIWRFGAETDILDIYGWLIPGLGFFITLCVGDFAV
jgi:hypothetical protein